MDRPDISSGASLTPWLTSASRPLFPALAEDLEVDVAVVGAGIAGLTAAYLLTLEEGLRVAVLEDGTIGSGETGRTTAHLASALDDRFHRLEKLHGEEGARLAFQSHEAAIDQIEAITRRHRIECDFARLPGYLFAPPGASTEDLDLEFEACRRVGFKGVQRMARAPLGRYDTGPCLLFPRQGQFHPLKYLAALAEAVTRQGGRIFERTHVEDYEAGDRVKIAVRTKGAVTARAMVVATNAPIVSRVSIPLRQYPYRTYVVALRVPPEAVPKALFWDTADPYHYVRLQTFDAATELLIVGGEDHKTGQPGGEDGEARYGRLESWIRERVPQAGGVAYRWSGQIMEPADGLAFIGRFSKGGDNVYVATGDSGHGMTHGTIAGMVIRDLIVGRGNAWAKLYDPGRVGLKALGEIAAENVDVVPQYGKWLTKGDVASPREIPRGEGRVVRKGLQKQAIYRDERGELHRFSAVCPHLGCIVGWNGTEKTWVCPCHGSRFSARGEVLNGPANRSLEPVTKPPSRVRPEKKAPSRSPRAKGRGPGRRRTKG
jgi:glycine/D-amino acid oxidase-like deaminating enzyme/nitrite reductase/ring-hydroxylating ferredoxin subunit